MLINLIILLIIFLIFWVILSKKSINEIIQDVKNINKDTKTEMEKVFLKEVKN